MLVRSCKRAFAPILLLLSSITYTPALVSASSVAADKLCEAHDGSRFFDLSPLRGKTDYHVIADDGLANITLNVCGAVTSETWKLDNPETVGGFYRGAHGDVSIGSVNSSLIVGYGGPVLFLSGGSTCEKAGDLKASTVIQFVCDEGVFSAGQPRLVAQLPPDTDSPCAFFIQWRTHVACAGAKRMSIGGPIAVFASILFVALLAYIIGATYYNRMVLGLRGWDQVPRISLFSFADVGKLFQRMRRGRDDSFNNAPSWGSWRNSNSRDRGGFGRVSAGEEDAIIGRYSLDEDEDDAEDDRPLARPSPPQNVHEGVIRL